MRTLAASATVVLALALAVASAKAPAAAADSFAPLLSPQIVPVDPPAPIAHEALRIGRAIARLNGANVTTWRTMAYWRNPHHPWRALLRAWTPDGGHCDIVLMIRRVRILDHRRSSPNYGKWHIGRRMTVQRAHTVYCGR